MSPLPQSTPSISRSLADIARQIKALFDEVDQVAREDFSRPVSTDVRVSGFSLTEPLNVLLNQVRARLVEKAETARLQQDALDELSKSRDEIENLRSLSAAIALAQTRDEIVELLRSTIRDKVIPFGGSALYQGSEELGFTLTGAWDTTEADAREIDRQKTAGFLQWVIRAHTTIAMPAEGKYPTAVYVPMNAGNQVIGILLLLTPRAVDEFTQSDQERVQMLCSQAAVALENARLVDQVLQMKQYNENILISLTSGLLAVDLDGRVTTLNPSGLSILNMAAPDILGRQLSEVPRLDSFARLLSDTISTGQDRRNIELELNFGEHRQILGVSASPILADQDRVIGALGIFTDLTPIKTLELQVRRSDRLAVVGQLAAGAAHEIRNPLSAIRGNIQLLNRKLQKLPEAEPLLVKTKSIIEEVDRINRIVAGMMDMSKDGALQLARVSINKVVRDVGYIVEGNYKEAGVGLEFVLDELLPDVQVDMAEMKQVFLNLYQNALQAMSTNGKLMVTTSRTVVGEGKDFVQVLVADTGAGIDEKHVEKIFAPFFTTKSDGTGLGLSIVHRIVEEHKGRITVESVVGKGTTFKVLLPAAPAGSAPPAPQVPASQTPAETAGG
ncbi:MAG: hypothetical protein A3G34_14710 [Candidatus Lindowbacteria bacterium RIFCSPLOWO2_12_FULL_62_27]|nr:MAG: hypothetical protein A3G34_14710 [Candidatus Lindowbacteria bacterium RIFCSPLOWO2_12_FULL_62_27]